MPIIVFKCTSCGESVEQIVPMSRVKSGETLCMDCAKCGNMAEQVLATPAAPHWGCSTAHSRSKGF